MENLQKLIWHTEQRLIKDLIPTEGNPRQLTKKQAIDLEKSLKKFNLVDIPAINTDNRIISGHQRIIILKALGRGEEKIDVRVPNRTLAEEEHREYMLRANKNQGEWDIDLLANIDEDLLKDIGFESEELDKIFQLDTDDEKADKVLEIRETDIKLGDMFKLGNHRLLCGDATKEENVDKLMAGEKADIVFCDPPYGMNLDADFSDMKGIAGGNKYKNVKGDDRDYDPQHILKDFGYCKEIFLWGADYYAERILNRNDGCFFVWDKTEGGIRTNSSYEKQFGSNFELCWSKQKHKRQIIPCLWKGIFGLSKEDTKKRIHPTQKPTKLCEWFIDKFSKREQKIVDLFGGSGSTLIACEKTNRQCGMMEIDETYCQVIIDRWEQYTNKKAEKIK